MINTTEVRKELEKLLYYYQSVSLEEIDSVMLMNRRVIKFFFHAVFLKKILEKAKIHYRVLEINNLRQFQYMTTYFDTPEFMHYKDHMNGKQNRYKIRQRRYDVTRNEFFEVKFKTNKGFTLKSRIENNSLVYFNNKTETFLRDQTPYKNENFKESVKDQFTRITLVNNQLTERITLDYNISFSHHKKDYSYPNLGIVEVKLDNKPGTSMILKIMRDLKIRPQSISKYCLGVASLYQNMKINN